MFSKCHNNHVMTCFINSIKVFMKVIFSDDGFTGVRNEKGVGQLFGLFYSPLYSVLPQVELCGPCFCFRLLCFSIKPSI